MLSAFEHAPIWQICMWKVKTEKRGIRGRERERKKWRGEQRGGSWPKPGPNRDGIVHSHKELPQYGEQRTVGLSVSSTLNDLTTSIHLSFTSNTQSTLNRHSYRTRTQNHASLLPDCLWVWRGELCGLARTNHLKKRFFRGYGYRCFHFKTLPEVTIPHHLHNHSLWQFTRVLEQIVVLSNRIFRNHIHCSVDLWKQLIIHFLTKYKVLTVLFP